MLSSSATDARPVRSPPRSRFKCSRAPSIFPVTDWRMVAEWDITTPWRLALVGRDGRAERLAHGHAFEVAGYFQIKDDQRQLVVHAEADGGGVHDFQMLGQNRKKGDVLVFLRGRILGRIGIVDAVDLRALHDDLCANLHGTQRSG